MEPEIRLEDLKEKLKIRLKPERYEHTIGVYYTALCMAMKFEEDLSKTAVAALLHDCAKNMSDKELIDICTEDHVEIFKEELDMPDLLHQKAGAIVARKEFGIEDPYILNAIGCHTTGRFDMTLLDKIIFAADYIEPGRYKQRHLPMIRKAAFTDIDYACFLILFDTIEYLNRAHIELHPDTALVYEEFAQKMYSKGLKDGKS